MMERVEASSVPQRDRRILQGPVSLCVLAAAFVLITLSSAKQVLADSDAYERLEGYGFPQGLLPHTVTGYIFDANGQFTLYLEAECKVTIQNKYPLQYAKVITGNLSYGKLSKLSGITVNAYFVWWSITAISVNNNTLEFDVGILSATYPVSNFDEAPVCEASKLLNSSSLLDQ